MQYSNLTWRGRILWGGSYVSMVNGMAWLLHLKRSPNRWHTINRQTHQRSSRISTTEIDRQRIALNFWKLDNEHSLTHTQWLRHMKIQFWLIDNRKSAIFELNNRFSYFFVDFYCWPGRIIIHLKCQIKIICYVICLIWCIRSARWCIVAIALCNWKYSKGVAIYADML